MIGGTVVETIIVPAQVENDPECDRFGQERWARVWVNCRDRQSNRECAIYVEYTDKSRSISEGDVIWWQGNRAYWTPTSKAFVEMPLQRIGCSGVSRPDAALTATRPAGGDNNV